jgi:hypothetical protein
MEKWDNKTKNRASENQQTFNDGSEPILIQMDLLKKEKV